MTVDERGYCTDCDSNDCLHAQLYKASSQMERLAKDRSDLIRQVADLNYQLALFRFPWVSIEKLRPDCGKVVLVCNGSADTPVIRRLQETADGLQTIWMHELGWEKFKKWKHWMPMPERFNYNEERENG